MGTLRRLRSAFGITAERVAVRPDMPWYWRVAAVIFFAVAVAWGAFNVFGRDATRAELEQELRSVKREVERQESELVELRSTTANADRQVQTERAAAADLAAQVKSLTFENAKLKEDLAFFQSLMSSSGDHREATLNVNRFKLRPDSVDGEYRYQMLLVQTGQRVREFRGTVQFVLDLQQDGRKVVLVLPQQGEREARDYRLTFKYFQRVEGTFKLAPGSVLKGMQVRVFEDGAKTPRLTQALNVS